jgi:hypothetical protein
MLKVVASAGSKGDVILNDFMITSQASVDPSTIVTLVELADASGAILGSSIYFPSVSTPGLGAYAISRAQFALNYRIPAGATREFTVRFSFAAAVSSGTTIAANAPLLNPIDAANPNLWVTTTSSVPTGSVMTFR